MFVDVGIQSQLITLCLLVIQAISSQTIEHQVFDLLNDYIVNNSDFHAAMTPIPSHDGLSTAYLFKEASRSVCTTSGLLQTVSDRMLNSDGFTLIAVVRQQTNSVGTIFSIGTTHSSCLELESSGWRKELRLHFTHKSQTRTETFAYDLADNNWHSVAVSITALTHIKVLVDCQVLYERRLIGRALLNDTPAEDVNLWIGQRNAHQGYFKGAIEYVKLVTSPDGYLEQCPKANIACPTCSAFQQLENLVHTLQATVVKLTEQMTTAHERIAELEQCECKKECHVDGQVYRDGVLVETDADCTHCVCRSGVVQCTRRKCPKLHCSNSLTPPGECCPICPRRCLHFGTFHESGEVFSPKKCFTCSCEDGRVNCVREDPKLCPKLQCPRDEMIRVQGSCCKVCRGTDFCSSDIAHCPANSSCVSLSTTFTCRCNKGFVKHGRICIDVDECAEDEPSHGSHCHRNTRCVNSVGSHSCECLPGYTRVDAFNCRDVDECESGAACSAHSVCFNTPGSYRCGCREGFRDNGTTCRPVCLESCQNGGHCAEPGICSCRRGYTGNHCQIDIDECLSGLATCHTNSACVNVIGSYFCECKPGFLSAWGSHRPGGFPLDNSLEDVCVDLNECGGWGAGHDCPAGSECRNLDGGYECICTDAQTCTSSCNVDGVFYSSGDRWSPKSDPCSNCRCERSRVICEKEKCDCSHRANHRVRCCEHCLDSRRCQHQHLPLTYRTGDVWQYQCQTCQCQNGEVDCHVMPCPKLDCSATELMDGDCCPRCVDTYDPCLALPDPNQGNAPPCVVNGKSVPAFQTWTNLTENCVTCRCLGGNICCSYNQSCNALQAVLTFSDSSVDASKPAALTRTLLVEALIPTSEERQSSPSTADGDLLNTRLEDGKELNTNVEHVASDWTEN